MSVMTGSFECFLDLSPTNSYDNQRKADFTRSKKIVISKNVKLDRLYRWKY